MITVVNAAERFELYKRLSVITIVELFMCRQIPDISFGPTVGERRALATLA
jgi:hypothetical protein